MSALCFWSLTNAGEAAAISSESKITWSIISYLGSQTTPVLFYLFILTYTQQTLWLTQRKIAGLFVIPVFSIIMAATNSYHRQLWPEVTLSTSSTLGIFARYSHGPWFWVEIIYAYILLSLSIIALLQAINRFPNLFNLHQRILLVTALAPWLVSILYAFIPEVVMGTDMTPVAFTWTGIWLYISITRLNFLNIVPIARNQMMGSLREGILLFDNQHRLLEANKAAREFFQIKQTSNGKSAVEVLHNQPEILVLLEQTTPSHIEIEITDVPRLVLQVNYVPLLNPNKKKIGSLITTIDVSERRKIEDELRASEIRYRLLVENQGEGILIVNNNEIFTFANRAAEHIYGVEPGTLAGRNLLDFIPPDQLGVLQRQITLRNNGKQSTYELQILRPDGQRRTIEVTATRHDHGQEGQRASFVILRDITERKHNEIALLHSNNALRSRERFLVLLSEITRSALEAADLQNLLQVIPDQIGALYSADGCFITIWDETQQLTVPIAAFGSEHDTYSHDLSMPGEITMTESVLKAGHALVAEDVFNSPFLSPGIAAGYPTRSLLGLPLIAGGRKIGAVLVGFNQTHIFTEDDITMGEQVAAQLALAVLKAQLFQETITTNQKLQKALADLDRLATTDKLTGALNRHKFDELVNNEMTRLDRYHHPVSLILFDIDHFKEINDTFGHHIGDQVLVQISYIVQSNIRSTDKLFRWGGDEFLILTPNIGNEQAFTLAEKIRLIIMESSFQPVERLTISMGISELSPGESPEVPVRRADQGLYLAKQNGRNCVETVISNLPLKTLGTQVK